MADKQPHLNGAYYGPSVPPPQPPQPAYRRGRSCCGCLFGFFWKLLLALIVIAGLAVLIFWLVVQPRHFKFYVSDAKLTQFDLPSNDNNLRYDLVLNFTARNPNKKLSVYYDRVEARAFYEDQRFDSVDVITHMNSFRQYTKSSDPMSAHFSGQHLMLLNSGDLQAQYNEEKTNGAFNIDVRLYFRIRFRLGDVISGDYHPRVKCELRLPLTSNTTTTTAPAFKSTKCDVDF